MLKTVSSISNAIGALNYKGTWNASTNTPALSSGAGTKGDYYVVSVAGSTTLDGISNWGVGDWAAYNGSVWQRVEGGADLNGVNLSVSGTSTLSALTASTALALNASKEVVSVTNTGTGNNVLATSPSIATPTLTGNVQMSTGNLVVGTSGKGIDFTVTPGTGTSELFADYEEGTWTVVATPETSGSITQYAGYNVGSYTKIGRMVTVSGFIYVQSVSSPVGNLIVTGLPYAIIGGDPIGRGAGSVSGTSLAAGATTSLALRSLIATIPPLRWSPRLLPDVLPSIVSQTPLRIFLTKKPVCEILFTSSDGKSKKRTSPACGTPVSDKRLTLLYPFAPKGV